MSGYFLKLKFAIKQQAVISEVIVIYGRHFWGWFRWWHFLSKVQRLWLCWCTILCCCSLVVVNILVEIVFRFKCKSRWHDRWCFKAVVHNVIVSIIALCSGPLLSTVIKEKSKWRIWIYMTSKLSGWPLVWKTWKCQGIWQLSGKCQRLY